MKAHRDTIDKINALSLAAFMDAYVPTNLLSYTPSELGYASADTYTITLKNAPVTGSDRTTSPGHDPRRYPKEDQATEAELEACFDIIAKTSSGDYAASAIGWRPAAKRAEMREPEMKYLLVRRRREQEPEPETQQQQRPTSPSSKDRPTPNGTTDPPITTDAPPNESDFSPPPLATPDPSILGFLSLMPTLESLHPVLYIYEIHLLPCLRSLGLARHLFRIAASIASAAHLSKTMLTVFRRNEHARKVYARLGFEVDEDSPRPRRLRGGKVKVADYLILSKGVRREEDDDAGDEDRRNDDGNDDDDDDGGGGGGGCGGDDAETAEGRGRDEADGREEESLLARKKRKMVDG